MSMKLSKKTAVLSDVVTVEDAEPLLQWLQEHPKGWIDLAACTHIHAASLQALMAARVQVATWPADAELTKWLKTALS